MSLLESSSDRPQGVLVRRPRTNIYTVLLLVALVAIAFSCLLLVLELFSYDLQIKPPANLQAARLTAVIEPLIA